MLAFLRGKASDRKLRLFAVACCRRIRHLLTDDRNMRAIEVAERYADGLVPKKTLKAARRKTFQVRSERPNIIGQDHQWGLDYAEGATDGLTVGPHESAQDAAYHAAIALAYGERRGGEQDERFQASRNRERLVQARLVHDIFANPFHPITINLAWLSWNDGIIPKLAQAIYDDRAFDRLPILADALEEAGCTDADILNHCRQPGEHVRGCWVVDLVLGKS
jgi:hypothetical protein